jgi:hypothetical protein
MASSAIVLFNKFFAFGNIARMGKAHGSAK